MKKPAIIAVAIVLAASAGWSGLWFKGRGAIDDRLDREIAQLRAQGVEITHGGRAIGGFPFGYRVTHRDVTVFEPTSGAAYHLPEVTTEVAADDIDQLITRFPTKFRLEVPLNETQHASWPGMPEVLTIDAESSDLVLISDGVPGEGQEIAITAASMLIVTGSADQPLNFAVEFTALDFKGTLPALSSGLPTTGATTVDRLDYAYTVNEADGTAVTLEASIDNLRLTGKSDIRDQAGLLAMLASGTGTYSLTYQTGASQGVVRAGNDPENLDGAFNFAAGSTAGTFSLANGLLEIATTSQANQVTLTTATSPDKPQGEAFGGEMRAVEMHITAPFAPSDRMSPIALRFALDQIAPDDAVWQLIDADGKLPRDPARLVIDIEGNARITGDLTKHRPGDDAPFEIGKVSIRSADITALGAGVTASGDVEFLQPLNQPMGAITVTLTQANELLDKLVDAGLVDAVTAQTVVVIATIFAVPGAAPGELVSEIAMGIDGITVNGQPIGGN